MRTLQFIIFIFDDLPKLLVANAVSAYRARLDHLAPHEASAA
jgi:hypothetical protein